MIITLLTSTRMPDISPAKWVYLEIREPQVRICNHMSHAQVLTLQGKENAFRGKKEIEMAIVNKKSP